MLIVNNGEHDVTVLDYPLNAFFFPLLNLCDKVSYGIKSIHDLFVLAFRARVLLLEIPTCCHILEWLLLMFCPTPHSLSNSRGPVKSREMLNLVKACYMNSIDDGVPFPSCAQCSGKQRLAGI